LEKFNGAGYISEMTAADLKNLLERIRAWPEEAQNELVAIAAQIESELQSDEYTASQDELQIIDEATASLDAGKK
jgi:ribosome-binding ATPase YchF (GTP1/OBG family)